MARRNFYSIDKLGIKYFSHPTSLMRVPFDQLDNYAQMPHGYFTWIEPGYNDVFNSGYVAGSTMHSGLVLQPRFLEKYNHDFFLPTVALSIGSACRKIFPNGSDISVAVSVLYPYTKEYGATIGSDIRDLLTGLMFIDESSNIKIHVAEVKTAYETMGGILCWELTHSHETANIIGVADIGGGTTEFALWDRHQRRFIGDMGRADFGINDLIGELGRKLREESEPGGRLPLNTFRTLPPVAQVELVLQNPMTHIPKIAVVRDEFLRSVSSRIENLIAITGINLNIVERLVTIGGGGLLFGSVIANVTQKQSFSHAYEPDANLNYLSNSLGGLYGIMPVAKREHLDAAISIDIGNALTKVSYVAVNDD